MSRELLNGYKIQSKVCCFMHARMHADTHSMRCIEKFFHRAELIPLLIELNEHYSGKSYKKQQCKAKPPYKST